MKSKTQESWKEYCLKEKKKKKEGKSELQKKKLGKKKKKRKKKKEKKRTNNADLFCKLFESLEMLHQTKMTIKADHQGKTY